MINQLEVQKNDLIYLNKIYKTKMLKYYIIF